METNERQRRVGTFTLGVVLVVSGALMLASMFWPQLDWEWALKCSPPHSHRAGRGDADCREGRRKG